MTGSIDCINNDSLLFAADGRPSSSLGVPPQVSVSQPNLIQSTYLSEPNLIRSTTVHITQPDLGLSFDDSGSLCLLPTPFESSCGIPLTGPTRSGANTASDDGTPVHPSQDDTGEPQDIRCSSEITSPLSQDFEDTDKKIDCNPRKFGHGNESSEQHTSSHAENVSSGYSGRHTSSSSSTCPPSAGDTFGPALAELQRRLVALAALMGGGALSGAEAERVWAALGAEVRGV